MGFNCGIVGLPNVGKSTLFNALTQTAAAEVMNYPFCTIEPNVGRIGVPDKRLQKLAALAKSEKIIPTQLEIVDIAGLVKGASKGEGLGNQFLGNIRNTDAILHVVRCFKNDNIVHVDGFIDPIRDIETIEMELIFSDIETLDKRLANLTRKKSADMDREKSVISKLKEVLDSGKLANSVEISEEEKNLIKSFNLLTMKPVLYVCNVNEADVINGNEFTKLVDNFARQRGFKTVIVSAAIESEIAVLNSQEEKDEFLAAMGLEESGLSKVIRGGYDLLNMLTFFTIGPKEAHAWTTKKNATAPMAAGEIHSDFERGFICAETISYEDFIKYNGELGAKSAGKMRLEGKEYIVNDGDIFHFRFNV